MYISHRAVVEAAVNHRFNRGKGRVTMNVNKLLAICVFLVLATPALSDGATIFYRDASGDITKESRQHARAMHKTAREQGYVTLWVLFDLPFDESMHDMTEQEMAEHEIMVATYAGEVLGRLVSRNQVWHPKTGPIIAGLGCHVRATPRGPKRLLKDERIIQIVATDS